MGRRTCQDSTTWKACWISANARICWVGGEFFEMFGDSEKIVLACTQCRKVLEYIQDG